MSPTYGFLAGPYLAKGCTPDFNNGLRSDSNSGHILANRRLFESDSSNGPQAISILSYICSCLLLMVSWQVPCLAKGCRPDFNNGLRSDSNSGPILALRRLFESDSNNGPSPGHLNLASEGATSVHVSYLWFLGRSISGQGLQA